MAPGVEFVVSFAADPVLYVIKRQFREDAHKATQQAFYYVLRGSVYQASSLHACAQARMKRFLHHLNAAFIQLKRDLEPLSWQAARAQQLKRLTDGYPAHVSKKKACTRDLPGPTGADGSERVGVAAAQLGAARAAVQHESMSTARWARIKQGDNVILNVLQRSVPCLALSPPTLCAAPAISSIFALASCSMCLRAA